MNKAVHFFEPDSVHVDACFAVASGHDLTAVSAGLLPSTSGYLSG